MADKSCGGYIGDNTNLLFFFLLLVVLFSMPFGGFYGRY